MTPYRAILPLLASVAFAFGCSSTAGSETEEASEDELRAVLGTASLDPSKPARILLVGDSAKLGDAPLQSALARGRRYREEYPNDQVVVYMPDADTSAKAARYGLTPVSADYTKMRGTAIVESMRHFSAIVSIDFYGHSSPFGISLDHSKGDTNIKASTPNVAELASRFARDRNPYATFNGCNAGIVAASELSALWRVPISGAYTGSNFERLHRDGHWYADLEGQTPSKEFVTTNAASYRTPVPCGDGACYRLRPTNYPYSGYWGKFGRGLGHYKFFCNFEDEAACAKGMAHSLIAFPSVKPISFSSSREDFQSVLLDYLCPATASASTFETCAREIQAAAESGKGYTPYANPTKVVECSMKSCDAEILCRKDASGASMPGTCTVKAPPAATESRTTPEEYKWFLRGFDLLKAR